MKCASLAASTSYPVVTWLHLADDQPLFFSRKHARGGQRRPISRQQAWEFVRAAADRGNVRVPALRASHFGQAGEPAPVHPHLFRHARVRQIVRTTKSLLIAQKQGRLVPPADGSSQR